VQACANEVRYLEKFHRETEPIPKYAPHKDIFHQSASDSNSSLLAPHIFAPRLMPKPRILREDFCGTAQLSATWVQRDVQREAYGVDIDREVVAWARSHHGVGRVSSPALRLLGTGSHRARILCLAWTS